LSVATPHPSTAMEEGGGGSILEEGGVRAQGDTAGSSSNFMTALAVGIFSGRLLHRTAAVRNEGRRRRSSASPDLFNSDAKRRARPSKTQVRRRYYENARRSEVLRTSLSSPERLSSSVGSVDDRAGSMAGSVMRGVVGVGRNMLRMDKARSIPKGSLPKRTVVSMVGKSCAERPLAPQYSYLLEAHLTFKDTHVLDQVREAEKGSGNVGEGGGLCAGIS
jgi:hypothetical protein